MRSERHFRINSQTEIKMRSVPISIKTNKIVKSKRKLKTAEIFVEKSALYLCYFSAKVMRKYGATTSCFGSSLNC